jgi:alcohol dehydrogenase class IV
MMIASTMGATAFQKGLGAMHSLSHPCSANLGTHHGLTNAVVMPYVLAWNRSHIEDRMKRLAAFLELEEASFDSVLKWIIDLRTALGVPHTLAELGMRSDHVDTFSRQAFEDPSTGGNPRPLTQSDFVALYRNCLEGRIDAAG